MQLGEAMQAASFPNLGALEDKTTAGTPMVMVLGPTMANDLADVGQFLRKRPEINAIMVVEELTTTVLQQAIRAGVSDVITVPSDSAQLIDAVQRAAESLTPVPAAPSASAAPEAPSQQGRVVTVFSTKGGAGKSVIAANLAISLAKRSERPVVLLDADLQFGDVAVMLKLTPPHTIVDAVEGIDRLDAQMLQSLLVRHERSNLRILAAPVEPAFADQVSGPNMAKIIQTLRSFCGYVVIDTPAHFGEVVLSLLEASDDIVLVAGMDIPNIKNVKIGLQVLRLLDIPVSKLKLVLNRSNAKVKLDIGEVERTLQLKADALVPSDILVPQSVNKGVPVVIDSPKSAVARSIETFAEQFLSADDLARRH
jgi:pilus assembly protein CpaE